jgi:hypothetical protein
MYVATQCHSTCKKKKPSKSLPDLQTAVRDFHLSGVTLCHRLSFPHHVSTPLCYGGAPMMSGPTAT